MDVIPLNETSNIGSSSISTINQILGISSNQTDTQLSLYKSLIKSSSIAQILANDIDFVKLAGESWDSKNNSIRKSKKTSLIKLKSLIKFFGIPEYESDLTNIRFILSYLNKIKFRSNLSGMTEVYVKPVILIMAH